MDENKTVVDSALDRGEERGVAGAVCFAVIKFLAETGPGFEYTLEKMLSSFDDPNSFDLSPYNCILREGVYVIGQKMLEKMKEQGLVVGEQPWRKR